MLKHITRIAYKQPPEKGDKGERGARTLLVSLPMR